MSENDSTDPQDTLYDFVIVGGGPAGLSAAVYAARATLKTIVLDKNPAAGALAAAEKIENYPGVPHRIKGEDLLSLFREQAEKFGAVIVQAQVVGVQLDNDVKQVTTSEGVYRGKTVLIATGAMGRNPTIKGEEEFMGKGVSYCAVCDAPFFAGKKVAAVGDIDEIMDEIDSIAKFADTVYVVPRKSVSEAQMQVLQNVSGVKVLTGHRVKRIEGKRTVENLVTEDSEGEHMLDVAGIFVFLHGNKPIVDFLYGAVETTSEGCIKVSKEDMSTSVEGVYAAGDVTCKKFRQVVIAAAEGCTAALSADTYINQRKRVRVQWG